MEGNSKAKNMSAKEAERLGLKPRTFLEDSDDEIPPVSFISKTLCLCFS